MICYRDMMFCSDAEGCRNRHDCHRWLTPKLKKEGARWWGGEDFPVAYSSFKTECKEWSQENEQA